MTKKQNKSNLELIEYLKNNGTIKSSVVEKAMKLVDRKDFVPINTLDKDAYNDSPQPIGFNTTISAPHMHANTL